MLNELIELKSGTPAKASEVNKNFEYVQDDVLNVEKTLTTSISNAVTKAKEELRADMENAAENLTDLNMSNISEIGIQKILNYVFPNTTSTSAVSINSGFVAPSNGWVYVNVRAYSGGTYKISLNGYTLVSNKSDAGLCSASFSQFVLKGDEVTFTGKVGASFRPTISQFSEEEAE